MRGILLPLAALSLLCLGILAQADVFNLGPGLTNLGMVTVGNPENSSDDIHTGHNGAVAYTYQIGKYEVTAAQYVDFLNHKAQTDTYGLYYPAMWGDYYYGCKIQRSGANGNYSYSVASNRANRPVNYVSYWSACRFTNWLHNGQGDGDTETGAYTLNDCNGLASDAIQRNVEAKWAISSEDEWYKAAYHDPTTNIYWKYPTQSNTRPSNTLATGTDPGNNATYYYGSYTVGNPYYMTEVGAHENSESAYATFDQAGNVYEWNETSGNDPYFYSPTHGLRGDSFGDTTRQSSLNLDASHRTYHDPTWQVEQVGFRVVALPVPEPATIITLIGGLTSLFTLKRRKR